MSTDAPGRRGPHAAESPAANADTPLELVVFAGSSVTVHPLPRSGLVTLGRSASNHVFIDDASVSRQHAVLHVGATVSIEDLGSANGTRMRTSSNTGETLDLADTRLRPGEQAAVPLCAAVHLGATTILVRPAESPVAAAGSAPVIVRDDAMRRLYQLAERVAEGPISVLLLGETGVGKEVLAETIHAKSPRAQGPFLRLNCAALSETLLESELFGHEKGAFTGAVAAKPGLFETADGGTVFLDEVGELPMAIQIKLLRVLEERKVLRVGGLKPRAIDVRFVSATNRDLDADIVKGTFRQDLFFRLNGIALTIPPLRERHGEIEELAKMFAARTASQMGRARAPYVTAEALAVLESHAWPGNVRELRNVIERAVVLCGDDAIRPEHLALERIARPEPIAKPAAPTATQEPARVETPSEAPAGKLWGEMEALERTRIIDALEKCAGNQTQAALLLGISRRTLVARLGEYNIPRPRKRS